MAKNLVQEFPIEYIKPFLRSLDLMKRSNAVFFEEHRCFKKYWRFLYILPCCMFFFISMLMYAIKMASGGGLFALADILPVLFIAVHGSFKGFTVVTKTNEINYILKELGALWPCNDKLTENQIAVKKQMLRRLNITQSGYYWIGMIGVYQYILTPLAECLFRIFILSQQAALTFPFGDSYPFDATATWMRYLGTYWFQGFAIIKFINFLFGVELLLLGVTGHLSTLFVLLKDDLLLIKPAVNENKIQEELDLDNEIEVCNDRRGGLGDIIRRHQNLIKLRHQFDDVINKIIFCNLLFASITICFYGFMATTAKTPNDTVMSIVAILGLTLPIFNLCYYGQLLQDASAGLADSAYNNLWYNGSTRYQKTLRFIILRSQKPCCITSLKYAPVTLSTFTKVMSTTWSYFSLMSSVYDG